jgi:hypothetical protein
MSGPAVSIVTYQNNPRVRKSMVPDSITLETLKTNVFNTLSEMNQRCSVRVLTFEEQSDGSYNPSRVSARLDRTGVLINTWMG